jgi:hypothetical protein
MKELSMDARYIELIESGRKIRTARTEAKANIGDVVSIFNKPYLVTDRRIYPFARLVQETYQEEGFGSPEEFSVALKRIYGDTVYGMNLYSHKFRKYDGEVDDKLRNNGHDACWSCSNLYSIPGSTGNGEFYCHNGNRRLGAWSYPRREIEVPKRCSCYDGCDK